MASIEEVAASVASLRESNDEAHKAIIGEAKLVRADMNGRIKTLELWCARVEGAAGALRVQWWVAIGFAGIVATAIGGVVAALAR